MRALAAAMLLLAADAVALDCVRRGRDGVHVDPACVRMAAENPDRHAALRQQLADAAGDAASSATDLALAGFELELARPPADDLLARIDALAARCTRAGDADCALAARLQRVRALAWRGEDAEALVEAELARDAAIAQRRDALAAEAALAAARQRLRLPGDLGRAAGDLAATQAHPAILADAWLAWRHADTAAALAFLRGRFEQAAHLYGAVAQRADALGAPARAGSARFNVLSARWQAAMSGRGRVDRDALAVELSALLGGDLQPGTRARVLRMLGRLLPPSEALSALQACVDIDPERAEWAAPCLATAARHRLDDDPQAARTLLDRAGELTGGHAAAYEELIAAELEWAWRALSPAQAAAHAQRWVAVEQQLRDRQRDDRTRAAALSRWSADHYLATGLLLRAADDGDAATREALVGQAFALQESLRSTVLHDTLGLRPPPSPPSDRAAWRMAVDAERTAQAREPSPPPALAQLSATLAGDQALVYLIHAGGDDPGGRWRGGDWALLVTAAGTRAIALPQVRSTLADVAVLAELDNDAAAEDALLARARDAIWAPVAQALPARVRRVVVVPDGALHALPFAAFALDDAVARTLSLAPSATLWLAWQRGEATSPHGIVGVADPVHDDGGTEAALPRLSHAHRELRALSQLGDATLLAGADADADALRAALAQPPRLLHVASHTRIADDPDRSAVLLSGRGDAAWLRTREIATLPLAGSTVVLSACESASGTRLRAEGLLGLQHAVLGAGARTLVANLWPVDDAHAAAVIEQAYAAAAAGAPLGEALTTAQRRAREAGYPTRAWAGWVLVGDPAVALAAPRQDRTRRGMALAGAVLCLVAVTVWRRGRRAED